MSFVYFIGARSLARVKIGQTQGSPHERMRALQTGSPERLEVLAMVHGGPSLEAELHERFAASRVHGEWFDRTPELDAFLLGIRLANPRAADEVAAPDTELGISFEDLEEIAMVVIDRRRRVEEAARMDAEALDRADAGKDH